MSFLLRDRSILLPTTLFWFLLTMNGAGRVACFALLRFVYFDLLVHFDILDVFLLFRGLCEKYRCVVLRTAESNWLKLSNALVVFICVLLSDLLVVMKGNLPSYSWSRLLILNNLLIEFFLALKLPFKFVLESEVFWAYFKSSSLEKLEWHERSRLPYHRFKFLVSLMIFFHFLEIVSRLLRIQRH